MKLWIDGDSCPREALQIALDAHRSGLLQVTVIADRVIPGAEDSGAGLEVVAGGPGAVDQILVSRIQPGDMALTRDLPLAMRLLGNGVTVLNDRGRVWTVKALKLRLEEAEIMLAMRKGGVAGNLPARYSRDDARRFAASLKKLAGRPD